MNKFLLGGFAILVLAACGSENLPQQALLADQPLVKDSGVLGGASRLLSYNPNPIQFGAVPVGTPKTIEVTVYNSSQVAQTLTGVVATNVMNSAVAWLSVDPASTCTNGLVMASGAVCVVKLICNPSGIGAIEGSENLRLSIVGGADQDARVHCRSSAP